MPYNHHYNYVECLNNTNELMKEKALRKHSLHEKTAASVLLKPFISSNDNATPLTPPSA